MHLSDPIPAHGLPLWTRFAAVALTLVPGTSSLVAANSEAPAVVTTWEAADGMMDFYCTDCHGATRPKGGLVLEDKVSSLSLIGDPEQWESIIRALRNHYMPHQDGIQMYPDERAALTRFLEKELISHARGQGKGSAPFRRLNRVEFRNTLEDLFLIRAEFAENLPADDAGYGFDNIAAALSFPPLLLEKYFDAAAEAAARAVPLKIDSRTVSLSALEFEGGGSNSGARGINSSGLTNAAKAQVYFPGVGSYSLEFELSAQQAGDEVAGARVRFDGQHAAEWEVPAEFGENTNARSTDVLVHRPGVHEISVEFINDFYRPGDEGRTLDRNLYLHSLKIDGPHQSADALSTPFLQRHFGDHFGELSDAGFRDGLYRLASRAYRRPAEPAEIESLMSVYHTASQGSPASPRAGLRAVIEALITSPSFLFRDESGESEFHLATWLSYFLWSSMPDDRLFELARKGELQANLESETERMLADPRAGRLSTNFAAQWWQFRDLRMHAPDKQAYPAFDRDLEDALYTETKLFFQSIVDTDGSLLDFLNADYTFVNERLARHYGLDDVEGKEFRRVSLAGTTRRGVWSHGSILTVTSHPNSTSPVLRGKWILENLIGLAPPPPPDNVPSLPETDGVPSPGTLRESLMQHREDPACASCHQIMDPIGLALEHYDGIGHLRSAGERASIIPETLFDGTEIMSPPDLARYFAESHTADFVRNVAHKMSVYATGRGLNWRDSAKIEKVVGKVRSGDYRFSSLIHAVVEAYAPIADSKRPALSARNAAYP